jgi:hypothetical protein
MSFNLKNTVAMYQKCMLIIQEEQIIRNIEAYIDDIFVKSKKCGDLLDDLSETLSNLPKFRMKLKPKKICVWCFFRKTTQLHGVRFMKAFVVCINRLPK